MVLLVHNTHLKVRGIGILHLLRSLSISLVILLTDIFVLTIIIRTEPELLYSYNYSTLMNRWMT
jgi:hypothetical protein